MKSEHGKRECGKCVSRCERCGCEGVRGCFDSGCGKLEADESSAKLRVWKVVLENNVKKWTPACAGELVTLAKRVHPFPSRTRPLSSSAPMILCGRLHGKIGRRRLTRSAQVFFFSSYRFARSTTKVSIKEKARSLITAPIPEYLHAPPARDLTTSS